MLCTLGSARSSAAEGAGHSRAGGSRAAEKFPGDFLGELGLGAGEKFWGGYGGYITVFGGWAITQAIFVPIWPAAINQPTCAAFEKINI